MKKIIALLLALLLMSSASALAQEAETAEVVQGPKVGIILYTMRNDMAAAIEEKVAAGTAEADAQKEVLFDAMERIAEMGYQGVQMTTFYSVPAAELKAKADELGLTLLPPHWANVNWTDEEWTTNLQYLVDAGIPGLILASSSIPDRDRSDTSPITQAELENWCTSLTETLKAMQAQIEKNSHDLFISYHSHSNEVIPIESINMNILDALYAEFGDAVPLELDIAWAAWPNSGADRYLPYQPMRSEGVAEYFMKRGNQYTKYLHLKDVDFETGEPIAIGQGDLEWNELFPIFNMYDVEWVIVENDRPESFNRDGFQDAQVTINYLKDLYQTLGWTW